MEIPLHEYYMSVSFIHNRRSVTFTEKHITWCNFILFFFSSLFFRFTRLSIHSDERDGKRYHTHTSPIADGTWKSTESTEDFFSIPKPKNHRFNAHNHKQRLDEENWFPCAYGKSLFWHRTVFFFKIKKHLSWKKFSLVVESGELMCVCVCMSWGWMLKKRMKFSKFHLFRVFFHIKSSALFFFAFTKMPRRSSMKQNYKYLRLCSCFAAFASPLIPSPAKIKMCV